MKVVKGLSRILSGAMVCIMGSKTIGETQDPEEKSSGKGNREFGTGNLQMEWLVLPSSLMRANLQELSWYMKTDLTSNLMSTNALCQ